MNAPHLFTTGNAMTVRGALDSGCRFFAGYPITPASGIFVQMTRQLPDLGGVALSAPDEISALCSCIGASLKGVPAMTATSAPGWCLMSEALGYALMTETPVVVALVQRMGPSTGAATQGAQGDLSLVMGAVSGGYTFPVFAPSTAEESYIDAMRAFLWAERLRTPVVLLTDKEVATTAEVVQEPHLVGPTPKMRAGFHGDGPFRTYDYPSLEGVPPFVPVGGDHPVAVTGSAHNRDGELKKSDPETLTMMRHLQAKISHAEPELGLVDVDSDEPAQTLVISFGVSARAAAEAVEEGRRRGHSVRLAKLRTLVPLPRTALLPLLDGVTRVIVAEENHSGQLRSHLVAGMKAALDGVQVLGVNKTGGLIRPEEILNVVC